MFPPLIRNKLKPIKMKINIKDIIFKASAMLVVVGAVLPLFVFEEWVPYIFAVGAAGMSTIRLITPYRGKNIRMSFPSLINSTNFSINNSISGPVLNVSKT